MTVSSTTSRVQYATNGTTGPWSIPFPFVYDSHLKVVYTDGSGVSTTLTLSADYTAAGAGGSLGGTLTTTSAYATGGTLTILRSVPFDQQSDYVNGDQLPDDTLERDLDLAAMRDQQLFEEVGRAVQAPSGESPLTDLPAASVRADRLLAFNSSTGDVALSQFTQTQLASVIATNLAGGATTAAAVTYLPNGAGAVALPLQDKIRLHDVYPEEYGAFGDGSSHPLSATFATLAAAQAKYGTAAVALTDETDGVVIQYLINNGFPIRLKSSGIYLTSRGIKAQSGMSLIGARRWSGVASTNSTNGVSTIRYAGAGGADSYVALMSTAAVGVEPTGGTRDLQNVKFRDIVLDGNDIAWYGEIDIRAWAGNDLDNITITRTRVCGNVVIASWVSGPRGRHIYKNRGAGAWLGKNVWSFAGSTTVDQFNGTDWLLYYNGCDNAGVPFNTFADTGGTYPTSANADGTCGLAIYGARALKLGNLQCQQNDGPGLVLFPTAGLKGPIHIDGGYFEFNSRSTGASRAWATWTSTVVDSWNITIEKAHFGGTAPAHRITGTQVSRIDQGPKFVDCPIMGTVVADAAYTYWNLVGCDQATTIVGGTPATPVLSMGGFQTEPGGAVVRFRGTTVNTPQLGGSTAAGTGWTYSASNNLLVFRRIGDVVTFTGRITLTAKGAGATGTIRITNLPYTCATGEGYEAACAISRVTGMTTAVVSMSGNVVPGTTACDLYLRTAAATAETGVALADISNTTSFVISGSYITSDA